MTPYRADIDGLRAVSVLGVLAFHANFPLFAGGFAGVDVFFVISGFLITGLLISEKQSAGRIDLIGFWSRRIRRLLPALAFVLFSVLLASVFLLERISGEVGSLVRASIATIFLNANHFFLIDSGNYFSELAEHNPLLHMWSLSVEEQYYLLWPLLLSALGIVRKSWLFAVIAFLLSLSMLLSLLWSDTNFPFAFYLMPSRAWELLAGALVAVAFNTYSRKFGEAASNVMGFTGLFLILAFFVGSAGQMAFPAPAAIIPVLGAVLIIIAGISDDGTLISRFLGYRPLAYIGRISYPLYLWHWPILVIMRSRRLYEESLLLDCIGLIAALLLSIFTYEIIERKTWKRLVNVSKHRVILYGFIGMVVVLSLSVAMGIWVRFGIGYSESEKALYSSRNDKAETGCMFEGDPSATDINRCFPDSSKSSVLLWGDSHGEHWAPAITKAAEGSAIQIGVLTKGGCRPLPLSVRGGDCRQFNEKIFKSLDSWQSSKGLAGIIIAGRWADGMGNQSLSLLDQTHFKPGEYYDWTAKSADDALQKFSESLLALVKKAEQSNIKVLIILPSPVQRYSAQHCLALLSEQKCFVDLDATKRFSRKVENKIFEIAKSNSNLHVLDPKSFMCDDRHCPAVINGMVAYSDDDHLTKSYALTVACKFSKELQWLSGSKSLSRPD